MHQKVGHRWRKCAQGKEGSKSTEAEGGQPPVLQRQQQAGLPTLQSPAMLRQQQAGRPAAQPPALPRQQQAGRPAAQLWAPRLL